MLLLTDPVDEIWVGSVTEFDGKPLQSVAKGEVDLDSEDEKAAHDAEREEQEKDFAELLTWLKETLSDHVKEVRLSTRLTESPACLITDAFGITPALARMYRASGQEVPVGKRILELNPNHPLVTGLQQAHKAGGDDPDASSPRPPNCLRHSASRRRRRTRGSGTIRRTARRPAGSHRVGHADLDGAGPARGARPSPQTAWPFNPQELRPCASLSRRLFGRISGQFCSMYSRHAARSASP